MRKLFYLVLSLLSLTAPLAAQSNPSITVTPIANDSVNVVYRWSGLSSRTYDLSTFSLPRKGELEVSRIVVGTSFVNTVHKSVLPAGTRLYMAVRSASAANRTDVVYTPVVTPPVTPPPPPPPVTPPPAPTPTLTLTATPERITAGQSTTIAWSSTNITGTCTVSNGAQTVSGQPLQASYSTPLSATTTVTVTCGTLTRTVTITVDPVTPPVTPPPPPPVTPPAPPATGLTPNRPANYTNTLVDYAFNDAIPPGRETKVGNSGWSSSWNDAGLLRRGVQADAPVSPTNVLEWAFTRTGTKSGGGVGNLGRGLNSVNQIYISFWLKHDPQFEFHPISNKLLYLEPGNVILQTRIWESNWLTINIGGSQEYRTPTSFRLQFAQWNHIEYLVDAVNNRIQIWVNGQSVQNTSANLAGGYRELKLDSTWGGSGGTKTRDSFRWIDHIIVATP